MLQTILSDSGIFDVISKIVRILKSQIGIIDRNILAMKFLKHISGDY